MKRTAPPLRLQLLASAGVLLAACTNTHAYRPAHTAGNLDSAEEADNDGESVQAVSAPAAAPMSASASEAVSESSVSKARTRSFRASDTAGGRPATARPPRKLAQAAVPGRVPLATNALEPGRGEVPAPAVQGPVLIYTAQLTMAIFEVGPAQTKIEALVLSLGGYLAQKSNNALTVRVPVARFHEAIAGIEKIGDVTRRDISAEDVSQEFYDLEVRIKSARAVRERLEHLLARAVKVEDALGIEHELDRVVAEIERLEGRLKFLSAKATYSTITVAFAAQPKEVVTKGNFKLPFPWLDELGLSRLLDLGH
jgi:hypothetical protein